MEFKQYIGLGDSISTDDYPGEGLGGISLFYRNNDNAHPKYKGKDLVSRFNPIDLLYLSRDGASSLDVLENQVPKIPISDSPTLMTLTVGGNDILRNVRDSEFEYNLEDILDQLKSRRPNSLILLGTIYDPSDYASNLIIKPVRKKLAIGELIESARRINKLNKIIKSKREKNIAIANIHKHFLGHGVPFSFIPGNYWYTGLIELNEKGGSEVRKVFWKTLNKYQESDK